MTNDDNETAVTDDSRRIDLGDDYALVPVIEADGSETWWVLDLRAPVDATHGCRCADCAPHDHLGPDRRRAEA